MRLVDCGSDQDTPDTLGEIFAHIHFCHVSWQRVPVDRQSSGGARLYVAGDGVWPLTVAPGQEALASPGDLILLAPGRSMPAPPPDKACRVLTGELTFGAGADHPLLQALPDIVLVSRAARERDPCLDETVRLLLRHLLFGNRTSMAVLTRLSEIVMIEIIRSAARESSVLTNVMGAFHDRRIGAALALLHRESERAWTVQSLAAAVAMSRSRFAARFQAVTGHGPLTYLQDLRLRQAEARLRSGAPSVREVARHAGYRSASGLTRAFAHRFGQTPGAVRPVQTG